MRFRDVVDRATSDGPFLPVSTALIATLILTSYQWDQLAGAPALWLLMGSGVGWVCLFALNLAFRGAPAFLPPAARALAAPLCLVAVGVAVGAFLQWGTDGSGRMQSIFVGGPIYGAVGVTLALARAANRELRDSLDSLSQADVDFSRQIKRLRMQEWCTQRRVARALHGPVQAIIAASAGRLRSEQAAGFDRVRADLEAALQEETADDHATWSAGLARVKSTWRGLCDVRLDEDEAATALLDGDPLCAEIALEIVSEAVSNAIRHGKATEVRVTAMIEGSDVHLTVIDNGRGGAGAATGLGTQLLQDCALEWTRDESSFQSALHASLPMR